MSLIDGSKILMTGFRGRLAGSLSGALTGAREVWGAGRGVNPEEREFWERWGMKLWIGDLGAGDFTGLPDDFDYVIHSAADIRTPDYDEAMRANAEAPALLMQHCRKAKAFLHVSTCGVYHPNKDPWYAFKETDPVGGAPFMGHYTGSKTAGEGAVRAMARLLNLPTIICRLNMQYGTFVDGGLPASHLRAILTDQPIVLPQSVPFVKAPVHEDDLMDFIVPSLQAAKVPAETINWCGDVVLDWREAVEYMGQLVGKTPIIVADDAFSPAPVAGDAAHRATITGPCKVHWKEGVRRIVEFWEPLIRDGKTALQHHAAAQKAVA